MRDMKSILGGISKEPEFKKINSNNIIKEVIEALPPVLKKGVEFAYTRNNILYFVLTHPVFKSEFTQRKSHIKQIVEVSKLQDIKDIEFFVTNNPKNLPSKQAEEENIQPFYKESAFGIFENLVEDEHLYKKFEEIRKLIQQKREED
jgi:hypothetical protein